MLSKSVKDDAYAVDVFLSYLQENDYIVKVDEAVC